MSDQTLNWLKLNHFGLKRQIKIRSDTKLAQAQSFRSTMPDQNRSDTELA